MHATSSLSSGYHPQSNGQSERCNQELETILRCVSEKNPSDWSRHLLWVEYAHNTLMSSSTGLSSKASLVYTPPLFPKEEMEILVPSVREHISSCRKVWKEVKEA